MEKGGQKFDRICETINVILKNHPSIAAYVFCRLANHQSILYYF